MQLRQDFPVTPAISVQNLVKKYGKANAVDGISFSVDQGEIFAILGPNGAGKTTTVEILEGYRDRDGGDCRSSCCSHGHQRRCHLDLTSPAHRPGLSALGCTGRSRAALSFPLQPQPQPPLPHPLSLPLPLPLPAAAALVFFTSSRLTRALRLTSGGTLSRSP